MTDIPASTMMRDGMARPSGRDMLGWVARGEVAMAVGVIGVEETGALNRSVKRRANKLKTRCKP